MLTHMGVTDWTERDRTDLALAERVVRNWLAADSPLYQLFTARIADDSEMLRLVAAIDNVPPLNLLYAGVQLMLTPGDALARWYPRYGGNAAPSEEAYIEFRAFALERRSAVVDIGRTRRTQTNEVGRSAVLLPFIVSELTSTSEPVHAVDVGASAGLNLCLDRYAYNYSGTVVGDSSLTLACDNRGRFPVPGNGLPESLPVFATRTGLDLAPVDVEDPDAMAWLEALVWPEQNGRLERLREAVAIRRDTPVTMVAGDAVETLAQVEAALEEGTLLLWHTVALYQLTDEQNAELDDIVAEIATRRRVVRIAFEMPKNSDYPEVRVGIRPWEGPALAVGHPHGAWLDRP